MADVADDIRDAAGEVFDTLRDGVFFDTTDKVTMLTASATEDEFTDVIVLDGQWFFEKDRDNNIVLRVAKSFEDLTDSMETATHFKVNDDVYTIADGDIKPPHGTDLFWEMKGLRYQTQTGYSVLR